MIKASQLSLIEDGQPILRQVDFSLEAGDCVGIIGPNGAGKTTLLRSLMRMDERATGQCNLWELSSKLRAQAAGWLAQERNVSWDLSVHEVIALGRIPWQGFAGRKHKDDQKHIDGAITHLGLERFANRSFSTLSGGERARVLIARLLAQNTPTVIADEPIAALDPYQQIQIMQVFRGLANEGRGVVISIHDLGLAARFCTRLVMVHKGTVLADGHPSDVLSDDNLAKVFGIKVYRAQSGTTTIIQPIELLENSHDKP